MQSKILFSSLLLAKLGEGYLLPTPLGKYNVTMRNEAITDYDRDARALMISIFQPAECANTVPVIYMPNNTAEYEGKWIEKIFGVPVNLTPLLSEARLPVCPQNSCLPLPNAPILLLSPGYRGSRLYYNFIASAIASEGYTVITMDHPGETNAITYLNGSTAYSYLPDLVNLDDATPLAYIRAADASFILDQLNNATALPNFSHKFPTDRVVMAGHSLGGATAHLAAGQDSRIIGIVNWDGLFLGSLTPEGASKPVLFMSTERDDDVRELAKWPEFTGPKLWVKIANLMHEGMLDLPSLLQAAGQDSGAFAEYLGSMAPDEIIRIMTAFTVAWMDGVLSGKIGGPLLEGKEPDRFPDVSVLKKENF